jgi:hypothetical protein
MSTGDTVRSIPVPPHLLARFTIPSPDRSVFSTQASQTELVYMVRYICLFDIVFQHIVNSLRIDHTLILEPIPCWVDV